MEQLLTYLADMGVTTTHLLAIAVGLGVFAVVFGLASATNTAQTPQQRRMRAVSAPASENAILTLDDNDPKGALKLFIPLSGQERSKIARMLRQAGIHRPRAVREFFLVRSLLSVTLPAVFLLAAWTGSRLPAPLNDALRPLLDLTNLQVLQIGVGLAALGFLAPFVWLRRKVSARKMAIWRGLPNALDLLRVSVEAGLGFDAAVLRVARELKDVAPAIAEEFTVLLLEIRAGKSRERAFNDLGARTGVEEISAFSSVVLQSAEFGTPLTEALATYAEEMRYTREMLAQEKANKLPVKMSGVLAAFMMPILLVISAGPVVIRMAEMFAAR
ncbi:MAG: type II secretion system F family protein [Maritimibacter sp.]|nr:type II secretion system F family protein [Maritimibacter sp.]